MKYRLMVIKALFIWAACCVSPGIVAMPEIQSWQTENGAQVLFIEAHSLPIVDVRIVFSAGSARDNGFPGLALLTNSLLMSGAGKLNADEIAQQLESVGAEAGTESQRDMALISMRSLSDPEKLKTMLGVMKKILSEPTFPPADLERDRKRLLAVLEYKQQQPAEMANEVFYNLVFAGHPYAAPPEGTTASVQAISREQIVDFYRRYYIAQNAVIAVVGALDKSAAKNLIETLLAELPAGEKPAPIPPVAPLQQAVTKFIPMPTAQTHILLGQPAINRNDPDYFPLYVGNHILGGGGFESRLMQDIREDRGLAYSVRSHFSPMAAAGFFMVGMQTRNEQAGQALSLLQDNLERFIEEGPTAEELENAVKNITGGFPLRIDSNRKLVDNLAVMAFYGLPKDYLENFNKHVQAVTVDAIQAAFKRRLDPERMVTVMAGGAGPLPTE